MSKTPQFSQDGESEEPVDDSCQPVDLEAEHEDDEDPEDDEELWDDDDDDRRQDAEDFYDFFSFDVADEDLYVPDAGNCSICNLEYGCQCLGPAGCR